MKTNIHLLSYLTHFFLECKMFQTKFVEEIITHILCSIIFCFNCPAYEIMCKNIVEPDRTQMTIWRMRIACWIPKATNTHSQYVILITFPLQEWLYEDTSMLRYMQVACLVNL